MKIYTFNYKAWCGEWKYKRFEATCDTDARFTARMLLRQEYANYACGFSLVDFYGRYIEI